MTDKDLTAYCGLFCGDCMRYMSRASELASELLGEFEKTQFSEYARVKQSQIADYGHYESMKSFLSQVVRLRCETPCRLGGHGCIGPCPIVECVKRKSLEGCWQCAQYRGCPKFGSLKPFCGDTPEHNLTKIKEHGPEAWAKHRGKFYPWKKEKP